MSKSNNSSKRCLLYEVREVYIPKKRELANGVRGGGGHTFNQRGTTHKPGLL